jgi:HPt (histidine-containing phosphotransfer) domain-containing protein
MFIAAGMNDYISKPIDPAELSRALTRWLPAGAATGEAAAGEAAADETAAGTMEAGTVEAGGMATAGGTAASNTSTSGAAGKNGAGSAPAAGRSIDCDAGLSNAAGDKKLYNQLLSDFLSVHGGDNIKLKDAISEHRFADATRFAHTLKGTSALIGANRLRRAAAGIETLLSEGESGKAEKGLGKLERELTAVIGEIGHLLPQ